LIAIDRRSWLAYLLLTRFTSFDEFKDLVKVQYAGDIAGESGAKVSRDEVRLTYDGVTSILKAGISQADFMAARNGNVLDRVMLGIKCPFIVTHKRDLGIIESMGRRRPWEFGKGDVAFYDLAEETVHHILQEDRDTIRSVDFSEKGYLNTFNHITAQSFMTSVFSEETADFVADVHELYNMPELISGKFTEDQLNNFANGPTDNYIDMLNNEWGQELGKKLKVKYSIHRSTRWTPELLTDYLNDIQSYYGWAFRIGFTPYRATDEIVFRFANKMNRVVGNALDPNE